MNLLNTIKVGTALGLTTIFGAGCDNAPPTPPTAPTAAVGSKDGEAKVDPFTGRSTEVAGLNQVPQKPKPTPIDNPSGPKARAKARQESPQQIALNKAMAKELENPNFTWSKENTDKIAKTLNGIQVPVKQGIAINDEDGKGQKTLYLLDKPGSELQAVRYRPAEGKEPAYLDLTGYSNGRFIGNEFKYDVVNIGDIYEGAPQVNGLPQRQAPTIELSKAGLSDDSINTLNTALLNLNSNAKILHENLKDQKFDPKVDKISIIQPEIREVTVKAGDKASARNYAEGEQTTFKLKESAELRFVMRLQETDKKTGKEINTNKIQVRLAAERDTNGNPISIPNGPKHKDPDGNLIVNKTEVIVPSKLEVLKFEN